MRAHPDLAGKAAIEGTLTPDSRREQASAGLDRLSPEEFEAFTRANAAYHERFELPFVICVRDHDKDRSWRRRGAGCATTRRRRCARRSARSPRSPGCAWSELVKISYGKLRVPLQRVVARDDGATTCSPCEVSVEVLGENFLAAYTEGDNREVVATDTMKNFILRESLAYEGDTLEGLIVHLGRGSWPPTR